MGRERRGGGWGWAVAVVAVFVATAGALSVWFVAGRELQVALPEAPVLSPEPEATAPEPAPTAPPPADTTLAPADRASPPVTPPHTEENTGAARVTRPTRPTSRPTVPKAGGDPSADPRIARDGHVAYSTTSPPSSPPASPDPPSRFPALHLPSKVEPQAPFTLTFRLTELPEVDTVAASEVSARGSRAAVAVEDEVRGTDGGMTLRVDPDGGPWTLRAVLTLEDLALAGGEASRTLVVPVSGDSEALRWSLVAPAAPPDRLGRAEVALFSGSTYLGRVFRDVRIGGGGDGAPRAATSVALGGPAGGADVHITVKTRMEGGQPVVGMFANTARYARVAPERVDDGRAQRVAWLATELARLGTLGRGVGMDGPPPEEAAEVLRGLGRRLWSSYVPSQIREAVCEGLDASAPRLPVIQVYTDDPSFPWELVLVSCPGADGIEVERGPLAALARVARWQQDRDVDKVELPPEEFVVSSAAVIAPVYGGAATLPAQARDVDAVRRLGQSTAVLGTSVELRRTLADPPGLVHFAGHGVALPGPPPVYEIALQDRELDPIGWSGMTTPRSRGRTLVFFNACQVGAVESTTGVVEGWAPEVIRAGAGAYIAPLWSVPDADAGAFAEAFYAGLHAGGQDRAGTLVIDALADARAAWAGSGRVAALAYVYYGSPTARVVTRR